MPVLNCDESLKQEIAELNGLKQGKVKIGVFSSVCTSWLPEILHSFKKKYTEIDIEVFQELTMMLYTGSRTEL